jgi:hypothetical protein
LARCFVERQQYLAKTMMFWRDFDHAPPLDVAWILMRARIAHAFGWQLGYIDGLSPATIAELLGYLAGI